MKKSFLGTVLIVLSSFLLFSCATSRTVRNSIDSAYLKTDYEAALTQIQEENKKGDLIDLNLDEAMLLFLNGMYKESADKFNSTNSQMSRLSGEMTAGQVVGAGLTSENSIKYSGPAYEYSLLDSMNAFNYMKLNDYDSARAMMRRSFNNNKDEFNNLKAKYKEINSQSENAFNSTSTQSAIKSMEAEGLYYDFQSFANSSSDNGDTDYKLSPFIFYLGAALFANDYNFQMAEEWIANVAPFLSDELVNSVVKIPKGKGSINVVSLADTIVRRQEAYKKFPVLIDLFGLNINFKLTWPVVPESNNIVKDVRVSIVDPYSGKKIKDSVIATADSEIIEDFDDAVRRDVASKSDGAFARSLIRNITRKTASYIGGIFAVKAAVNLAESSIEEGTPAIIGYLAVMNAVVALQLTIDALDNVEHADIRQCMFFPSKARGAGVILDPGFYTVVVDYLDKRGRVIESDIIENVEVKEGIPTVVPSEFINTGNFEFAESK